MAVDQSTLQMLQTEPEPEALDLSWMESTGERGFWAKPGRRGLTLEEIAAYNVNKLAKRHGR